MRILCEKHAYEVLEAYYEERCNKIYLCFRTAAPYTRYRIEIADKSAGEEILRLLAREGFVGLDYYAKKTSTVSELEKFDDSTLYREAMETFREAVEEENEKLPPIWTDGVKEDKDNGEN